MKKTMRKSALLSSVAMLIVSAIVLTSATYAWFSATTSVQVKEISSTVTSTTGLLISFEEDEGYNNVLDASDFVPETLSPASTIDGDVMVTGNYQKLDDGTYSLVLTKSNLTESEKGSPYMTYDLYVKGPSSAIIEVMPKFDVSSTAGKIVKFAMVKDEGGFLGNGVFAANGETTEYTGTEAEGNVKSETSGAYLVSEGSVGKVTQLASTTVPTFTLPAEADTPVHFKVIIWAEGNDPECKGSEIEAGDSFKFTLDMKIQGT